MQFKQSNLPWLNRNLLGFGIASFLSDASHEVVPLVLPALVMHLVGSQQAPYYLGIISGVSTAAASVTTLFSGWMNDHIINRKPLILSGYAASGLLVGCMGAAQSWVSVLLLHAGAWVGRGLTSAPRNAMMADATDPAYYGHAFGFRQAMDTAGAVAGPLIVYFLSSQPLPVIFFVTLIPGILAFLALLFLIQEIPHTKSQNPWVPLSELPRSFFIFLGSILIFGVGNFNKTLLLLRVQNNLAASGMVAALSIATLLYIFRNIVQAAASYGIGALSDRVGRKALLGLCGFVVFGCMSFALIWATDNLVLLSVIFLLSGISAGSVSTLEKSVAADLLPEQVRGTGYGILLTVDSVGDLLSSLMVGFLWTAFSPEIAFLYGAIMSFIAAAMLIPLGRYH